ncbi:hypothetical protein F4802DRAFT_601109 [Xylaria palmicola]|nr:hypothetical protein F4802DRAFT_601109 [Xylaria palmicola]
MEGAIAKISGQSTPYAVALLLSATARVPETTARSPEQNLCPAAVLAERPSTSAHGVDRICTLGIQASDRQDY